MNFIPDYYIYTDGACSGNGKEDAIAGMGIFFGLNDPRNVSEKVIGKQSNNTAELGAIVKTYSIIEKDIINGKNIMIVSDSIYAIRCVTTYGEKCSNKNWNVNIPNKELVKYAYDLYKDKTNVKFMYIKAHTNNNDVHSIGNFHADKLATSAIELSHVKKISNKIYLNVPYAKKEDIKKLGGKWDPECKKWYIYNDNKNKDTILSTFNLN